MHHKITLAMLDKGTIEVEIFSPKRGFSQTHTLANAAEHRKANGNEPREGIEADLCDYVWGFKHAVALMGPGYDEMRRHEQEKRAKRLCMTVGDTFEIEGVPATYTVEFSRYNRDQLDLRPVPHDGYEVKPAVCSGFGDAALVLIRK